jgi:hypothetical protein
MPGAEPRRPNQVSVSRLTQALPAPQALRVAWLATPPVERIVPDGVFDAFGWAASDTLEWRVPVSAWDPDASIDGSDPARMVFVVRPGQGEFLPRELARLHAFGLGLTDEEALAPWGIDAATDGLYEQRVRPTDALWLAADNLNALFWGLHDWAHFHNHGPFEQRAWTELQCDAAALAWLWHNRATLPLSDAAWERTRDEVRVLARRRFSEEGLGFDESLLVTTTQVPVR